MNLYGHFLEEKRNTYEQLGDIEWKRTSCFFTDVMNHLQALDVSLQGKDRIVSDLGQVIFSFHNKINLFQRDINTKSLQHFHLLIGLVNSENDLCSVRIKVCVES